MLSWVSEQLGEQLGVHRIGDLIRLSIEHPLWVNRPTFCFLLRPHGPRCKAAKPPSNRGRKSYPHSIKLEVRKGDQTKPHNRSDCYRSSGSLSYVCGDIRIW